MAHDAGKGAKPRPFSVSQEEYTNRLGSIFGKSPEPSDDDEDCKVCGGPMYTQIHWRYSYCDDCGASIKKEPMEP
jgi:hypothetical protein